MIKFNNFKFAVIALSVAGLTACGGGGGGKGGSSIPEERPAGTVTGVAHDGPIQNGKITAYKYTEKGKDELLASGTTDDVGDYSLNIKSADAPVYLEVNSGAYVEEASGLRVTLSEGQKLTALTFYESGSPVNLQLTQYTTWSQCYADYLIKNGATVGNAIVDATETFGNIAGLPIVGTRPIDITQSKNFSAYLTPGLKYGYLLAGISGLTQDLAAANNVPAHSSEQYTSIYFTSVVCSDIRFDGRMDGIGEPTAGNPSGQLYIGSVALTADHYRTKIAQNILEVAANPEINKAGIKPSELLAFANNIALNTNAIFKGTVPRGVDIEGPLITPLVANDSLVSGQATIGVSAIDPLGISSVEFYLDDAFLQNGIVDDLKATIITQNFSDGKHVLKIKAKDVLGNESFYDLPLIFVNSGANLTITSPTLTSSASYIASGSYIEGAAGVKRIVVKGVEATLDTSNKTWSAAITLEGGVNNVMATIYDQFDNFTEASASVAVDLIPPSIFVDATMAVFSNYSGQYNLCTYGELDDVSGTNVPVCLDAAAVSLNGRKVSASLPSDRFVMLGIKVTDGFGSGVFSDVGKLKVEYQYQRSSGVVVDWAPAPRQTASSPTGEQITDTIYLPLVTEYLGSSFYLTDRNEVHTVTFRITDEAGNSTKRPFSFKLDVLTPYLGVAPASLKNQSIFNVGFESRSNLNGATGEVSYVITNGTKLPYIVRFDAPAQHTMVHSYESAQRFNKARVNTQEQWRARFCKNCRSDITNTDSNWTAWAEVSSLTSRAQGTVSPPKTLGSYSDIATDVLQAPYASAWENYTGPLCSNLGKVVATDAGNGQGFACLYVYDEFSAMAYKYLQERNTYEVEYLSGYPKNVITQRSQTYNFTNNQIRLFDKATGQEIFSTSGWFKIPPSSTVEIVNFVKLPAVINYSDSRVAANDASVPYNGDILFDKSLSYTVNTSMVMKQAINPGDDSKLNGVSATTVSVGGSPLVATISR
jgi:hypothetical protein